MKAFASIFLFLIVFVGGIAAGIWCDRSDNSIAKIVVSGYDAVVAARAEAADEGEVATQTEVMKSSDEGGAQEVESERKSEPAVTKPDEKPESGKTEAKPKKIREEKGPWIGFWEENRVMGKPVRARDFEGNVALVCEWSADNDASIALLKRVEEVASSFRGKKLVVFASHRGDADAKAIKKAAGKFSFPVYVDAGLDSVMRCAPTIPSVYVVDHNGRIVYRGHDDRRATEQLVNAITECQVAPSAKGGKSGLGTRLK